MWFQFLLSLIETVLQDSSKKSKILKSPCSFEVGRNYYRVIIFLKKDLENKVSDFY